MSEAEKQNDRREFITGKIVQDLLEQRTTDEDVTFQTSTPANLRGDASEFLQLFSQRAMACDFQLFLEMDSTRDLGGIALKAFSEIARLERVMSSYRTDSELVKLNGLAFTRDVSVSDDLWEVLAVAKSVADETHGAFDPSATPLSRVWGFFDRKPIVPGDDALQAARANVGFQYLQMSAATRTVRFLKAGVEANLNSIGKGFALNKATDVLIDSGVDRFIIHGGQSSVVARSGQRNGGSESREDWTVGLTHPLVPSKRLGELILCDESMSTSGTARQGFFHEGRRLGHIIDPRSGWPAEQTLSVTVVHPQATLSDALATAFFVMQPHEVRAFCENHLETKALLMLPGQKGSQAIEVQQYNFRPGQVKLY